MYLCIRYILKSFLIIPKATQSTNEVIDLSKQQIPITKDFVEEVIEESIFKRFGKKVASGCKKGLRAIAKPFKWFKSLFTKK